MKKIAFLGRFSTLTEDGRQIGGFGGQWGDEAPNIQKKRKMLEEEGVIFEAFPKTKHVIEKRCMFAFEK